MAFGEVIRRRRANSQGKMRGSFSLDPSWSWRCPTRLEPGARLVMGIELAFFSIDEFRALVKRLGPVG